MENIISTIENDNFEEFSKCLFENHAGGKEGKKYTMPLSTKEECAFVSRVCSEQKNECWYKALVRYASIYPLANETLNFLLEEFGNSMAVKIVSIQYGKFGYVPSQAERACLFIKKKEASKTLLPLINAVCKYGRIYSRDLYNILGSLQDKYKEIALSNADYAEAYKRNVMNYRIQNKMLSFHS